MNNKISEDLKNRDARIVGIICDVDGGSKILSYDSKGNVEFISSLATKGLLIFAKTDTGAINLIAEVG